MLKKSITFTDFNGDTQTEDFYFNLTEEELLTTELSGVGNSFSDYMQQVIKANNGREIIQGFKSIIKLAYGKRTNEGRNFAKSEEILEDFTSSAAYSVLFMELSTQAGSAADFVNGIMPAGSPVIEAPTTPPSNANETAAERARRESEARLQGHRKSKKNQDEARGSQIVDVPQPNSDVPFEDEPQEMEVVNESLSLDEINALPISEDQKSKLRKSIGA